ncbi:hypothetical protein [Rathayibacter rathayi]|uniref:hypothetical protein n=1 Tax=Rathayibacter rathayi TaxID=33887 RepID=UPI000CE78097|nr:hypothetical protein [Rathayibacter rathayi]PPG69224.1 hypothetical protein C5C02_06730 [Rathayibacter rathayi]PPG73853.1 hypothetical protein C5C23_14255 [Rathayibacter rathayi]PPI75901.1 hypothetical protein C5E03_12405 [Rathayibacter rathayi]
MALASSAFPLFGGTRSRNPVSSGTPPERRSSPSPLPGPRSSWGRSSLSGPPDSVDAASDLHVEAIDAGQARNKLPFETESGDETAWVGRQYSRDHQVNPADPDFGVEVFGVETGGDKGRIVTNDDATPAPTGPAPAE